MLKFLSRFILAVALVWLKSCDAVPVFAATYYVATTGSNGAAGSLAAPWQTIKYGVAHVVAGDTLNIRTGTYAESISVPAGDTIPSGSAGNIITIQNYNGEVVTMAPTGHSAESVLYLNGTSYTKWAGLILDGTGLILDHLSTVLSANNSSSHNRFESLEIKNSPGGGIGIANTSNFNEFVNCNVHDSGTFDNRGHGLYIAGGNCSDTLVDGGDWHDNAKYGIHQYNGGVGSADRTIVRNTRIYNNGWVGGVATTSISVWGMLLTDGTDLLVYNNLFYGNAAGGLAVGSFGNVNRFGVYNNSFYDNSTDPSVGGGYGYDPIIVETSPQNVTIRNNIMYSNYADAIDSVGAGAGYVADHNLFTNPSWTNAGGAIFTVTAGSASILFGSDLSAIFTTDFLGRTRPATAFDAGPYDYRLAASIVPILASYRRRP